MKRSSFIFLVCIFLLPIRLVSASELPGICATDPTNQMCIDAQAMIDRENAAKAEQDRLIAAANKLAADATAKQQAEDQAYLDSLKSRYGVDNSNFIAGCREPANFGKSECQAQNLVEEQLRQRADVDKQKQLDAAATQNAINEAKAYASQDQAYLDSLKIKYGVDNTKFIPGCREITNSSKSECIAQNLTEEKLRAKAYAENATQNALDAKELEKYSIARQALVPNGRICTLYPEASTPGCIAEINAYNARLIDSIGKEAASLEISKQELIITKSKLDYLVNGRPECTTYPASLKPECVTENAKYADETIGQVEAIDTFLKLNTGSKNAVLRYQGNDVLIDTTIPKGLNIKKATVQVVDKNKRVVGTVEVKFDSTNDPYFVLPDFAKSGEFKIQYTVGKKKVLGTSIKIPKAN
jgi:rRNA processing protein Gar1